MSILHRRRMVVDRINAARAKAEKAEAGAEGPYLVKNDHSGKFMARSFDELAEAKAYARELHARHGHPYLVVPEAQA